MEVLQLAASFLLVFIVSSVLAYALGRINLLHRSQFIPPDNALLRVMTPNGVHRARFVGIRNGGWAFTAPLMRDAYVPISEGAPLVIEASSPGGALLLRTKIAERTEDRLLITEPARRVLRRERRLSSRVCRTDLIRVEGEPGQFIDVSEGGAKLITVAKVRRGDCIRVELPWAQTVGHGYVLEIEPERHRSLIRLRWDAMIVVPAPYKFS